MPPDIAKLEDEQAITKVLGQAIDELRAGTFTLPARPEVMALSRQARTAELAAVLDEVTAGRDTVPRQIPAPR